MRDIRAHFAGGGVGAGVPKVSGKSTGPGARLLSPRIWFTKERIAAKPTGFFKK